MELEIVRIIRPGERNECIMLRALRACNLSNYVLFDASYTLNHVVFGDVPHSFFFPSIEVAKDDFVILYSCPGNYRKAEGLMGNPIHCFYWDLHGATVWSEGRDYALLVKIAKREIKKVNILCQATKHPP